MTYGLRKSSASLAILGMALCIAAFVASFFGLTFDATSTLWLVLSGVIAILMAPPSGRQFLASWRKRYASASIAQNNLWNEVWRSRPSWVKLGSQYLGAFLIVNFVFFLIQSHATSPQIKDGQYVLSDHGHIKMVLT
jgi:hypothetical protein